MDQAEGLRQLVQQAKIKKPCENTGSCRILTISGGKGGVGKSSITANMAFALAESGLRVGIFDADMGLANIDIILGVRPKKNLSHVIFEGAKIEDIIVDCQNNIKLIPASSGVGELSQLSEAAWHSLINELARIYSQFDVFLVDTAAGIGKNVINFVLASQELIMVTTPDPTALADVYAMVKLISRKLPSKNINFLINMADEESEAQDAYMKLEKLITRNMRLAPTFLGWVPRDKAFRRALKARQCVASIEPEAPASKAILAITERWRRSSPVYGNTGNVKIYMKRIKNLTQTLSLI